MTATLSGSDRPLVEVHDALLLDLDGVVYVGPAAVPGAAEALERARAAGLHLAYVTNNASRPAQTVADHLTELGIPATVDEVVTAAMAAAALLRERHGTGARVLVVGGEGLYWALEREGLVGVATVDDGPVAVVQGFHPDVGWRLLAEGTRGIRAGLPYLATNTDLTVPTPYGPAPGNGTLVAAVCAAAGITPEVAGKPQPHLFLDAARRAGSTAPLVVGDRLDTDLEGARAAGVPGLCVLTGVSGPAELLACPPHRRPDLLGADLGSLFDAHPTPRRDGDGVVTCGQARATVDGSRLDLHGTGLDALRAACVAVWAQTDVDRPVDLAAAVTTTTRALAESAPTAPGA